MSKLRLFWVVVMLGFCVFGYSQTGVYVRGSNYESAADKIKWTLTLNEDGTFLYNFYRDLEGALNPEENFYGKGTWIAEGKVISFFTHVETEMDEKYTMNFTNTKARCNSKSPRDKSSRVEETFVWFYQSDLDVVKGLKLFKE